MSSDIAKTIENLQGIVTLVRGQVVYPTIIVDKVGDMSAAGRHPAVIKAYVAEVLKAVIAEAYLEGKLAAHGEIQEALFEARANTDAYSVVTIDDVNKYISNVTVD